MYDDAGSLFLGALLGGMGFFSFLVAPMAFRILGAENAGKFVRGLFPHYYLFTIAGSALSVVGCVGHGPVAAKVMVVVTALAILQRQWLMPRINAARDAGQTKRFGMFHGAAVVINFAQMAAALVAVILYV